MQFQVKIDTDNEAFGDGKWGAEVASILRHVAEYVEQFTEANRPSPAFLLSDANGNKVGHFKTVKARTPAVVG